MRNDSGNQSEAINFHRGAVLFSLCPKCLKPLTEDGAGVKDFSDLFILSPDHLRG